MGHISNYFVSISKYGTHFKHFKLFQTIQTIFERTSVFLKVNF